MRFEIDNSAACLHTAGVCEHVSHCSESREHLGAAGMARQVLAGKVRPCCSSDIWARSPEAEAFVQSLQTLPAKRDYICKCCREELERLPHNLYREQQNCTHSNFNRHQTLGLQSPLPSGAAAQGCSFHHHSQGAQLRDATRSPSAQWLPVLCYSARASCRHVASSKSQPCIFKDNSSYRLCCFLAYMNPQHDESS